MGPSPSNKKTITRAPTLQIGHKKDFIFFQISDQRVVCTISLLLVCVYIFFSFIRFFDWLLLARLQLQPSKIILQIHCHHINFQKYQ